MDRQGRGVQTAFVSLTAASVQWCIAIQHFLPISPGRHAHAVIVPRHRRKITNEHQNVVTIFGAPDKADDAPLAVVAINPFEARRVVIQFEQRWLPAVQRIQIPDPAP